MPRAWYGTPEIIFDMSQRKQHACSVKVYWAYKEERVE